MSAANEPTQRLRQWVAAAADPSRCRLRQAVRTLLEAIAATPSLQRQMILKGGMLLGIVHGSSRFTKDVDFSTPQHFGDMDEGALRGALEEALVAAVERLGYGLDCRIQRWNVNPERGGTTPTLQVNIGYALVGSPAHRRLQKLQATDILPLDYSFNETAPFVDLLACDEGRCVQTYDLHTLIAEKYRALLQQESRNRVRGQDVYDLHFLLTQEADTFVLDRQSVLDILREKAAARNIDSHRAALRDENLQERARDSYAGLEFDADRLPAYEEAFGVVRAFYEALPW